MPRNRADVDRGEKVEAIVAAAERRLLDGGLANLSVADIARELGVAQNAIYWYFPTKDHLFVAALDRVVARVLSGKPRRDGIVPMALWFIDRLHEFQPLRAAVQDRARVSPVVAEFHERFALSVDALMTAALAAAVPADTLDVTVRAISAVVDGVLAQGLTKRERERVVRFAFERLAGVT